MKELFKQIKNKGRISLENSLIVLVLGSTFIADLGYINTNWFYTRDWINQIYLFLCVAFAIFAICVISTIRDNHEQWMNGTITYKSDYDSYYNRIGYEGLTWTEIVAVGIRLLIKVNVLFILLGILLSPLIFYYSQFYVFTTILAPNLVIFGCIGIFGILCLILCLIYGLNTGGNYLVKSIFKLINKILSF